MAEEPHDSTGEVHDNPEMELLIPPRRPTYLNFRLQEQQVISRCTRFILAVFKVSFCSLGLWGYQWWNFIPRILFIEDNTWLRGDMKFIFECSTRYLTRSLRSLVRYRFEHEKINFISPSNHVLFCLFYKPTNNEVFDDFPKIAENFPKILKMLSGSHTNVSEHFPKFSENVRRLPRKIRICFDLISINLGPLSIITWQTL